MGRRSRLRSRLRFWPKSPKSPKSPKPPKSQPTSSTTETVEPPDSASVDTNGVSRVSSSPARPVDTPSLWQKAYEQLDANLVKQFNELLEKEAPAQDSSENGPNEPSRDDVDRICQDGQRRMEQAETTFRFKNEEHKAHDVFAKGLAVITWAKDLVSAALEHASSTEASLAWAATILVLPLFENIDTVRETNKTGFTYVTASMNFYVALETTFRDVGPAVSQDLVDATEESIVDLYRNILIFQLQSAIRFNRNKFKNKLRDVVDYDGWKEMLQSVKDAENLVNQRWELLHSAVGSDNLQSLREEAVGNFQMLQKHLIELRDISRNMDEVVVMMKKSETRAVSEAEQKHLQVLRHHNTTKDQSYELAKDRTERRVDGTCKWLLADEQYQAWLRTNSGLLVISADPGCGKSVLTRYLIEEGLHQVDITICYFFFKDEVQDRVHLALCALLHQLLASKPFLITEYLAPAHSKDGESLKTNVSALWKILESVLQDIRTGRVVIVVDGLDECNPGELRDFSDKVNSLFRYTNPTQRTRFIITTRPYDQITSRFNARHIRIAGELESGTIREEVKLVIQHRIKNLRKMPQIIPRALLPYLEERLLSVDHPTYLWAALTFNFIESGKFKKTDRGIHEAIKRLPRTINEAYEKILRKTDPEDKVIVRRALTVVLGAKRPMSINEMNVALNLTPSIGNLAELDLEDRDDFTRSLRNWTGLFITIYQKHVYFLHQTVREFLIGDSSSSVFNTQGLSCWHGTFSTCEANKMLTRICLQYIPLCCGRYDPGSWPQWPATKMYYYAVACIKDHLQDDIGRDLAELATHVLVYSGRGWTHSLEGPRQSWTEHEFALLLAAWNSLYTIVDYLLSLPDVNLECCDQSGRTPLVLILERGLNTLDAPKKSAIVSALLKAGANPNPKLAEGLNSPIVIATHQNDISMVTHLCVHGAAVDDESLIVYSMLPSPKHTALHFAARQCADEIVKALILAGANIEARTAHGETPLFCAVEARRPSTTNILLNHGAKVDSFDSRRRTPLHVAKEEQSATLLVHAGADIEARDNSGLTPLYQSITENTGLMTRALISLGADVNATNKYGRAPLYQSVTQYPGLELIRLLISGGADVNATDNYGKTPLCRAAMLNKTDVVALLISHGASVDAKDRYGNTPLHYAAREDNKEVVALLIDHGASAHVQGQHSSTPLRFATPFFRLRRQ